MNRNHETMRTKILSTGILVILLASQVLSQDFKPSKTQFMIRGYGHSGLNYQEINGEKEATYIGTAFSPIFLFKHSDRLLFEAELEFELENGEVVVGFEYADFNYVLNKYAIIRAGKFLLPFGTFVERLHPAWINRFSNMPLGFGHDGITPMAGIGIELRGAIPIGGAKINYSVYSTNGPTLKDGSLDPSEAGMLMFDNFEDNNNNKAIGGRIGILPFSNSSVELGFSAYSGKVGSEGDSLYENVGATLYATDFSFVRQISPIKGTVDIKAQLNTSAVDQANYYDIEPGDTIPTAYTFDNRSQAWFAQLSYRPSMLNNNVLRNFEIIGRYSVFNAPEGAEWEQNATQITFGLNYWLSWRSLIKVSYQITDSQGGHHSPGGQTTTRGVFVHWALGF